MTRVILSTSNLVASRPPVLHRSSHKSNIELVSGLEANFSAAQQTLGAQDHKSNSPQPSWRTWTSQVGTDIYIPSIDPSCRGLREKRTSYEITVKLFFLHSNSERSAHVREAIRLVLEQLQVESLDLLLVSFPGVVYDTGASVHSSCNDTDSEAESLDTMLSTWRCLEEEHNKGVVQKLGIAEFGPDRLEPFLQRASIQPAVDQISVKDVCDVPRDLVSFAAKANVDLQTHQDCTNILPQGTVRRLLDSSEAGAGILSEGVGGEGLKGDIQPQWVVKYTALVKARGVIESKGYFAVAEVADGE